MAVIFLPEKKDIDFFTDEVYGDFDVVTRNQVVITDEKKFNRLMHELKDFNKYVLAGTRGLTFAENEAENIKKLGTYSGLEYRRVPTGVEVVDASGEIVKIYNNPKANLTRLLNLDDRKYAGYGYGFKSDYGDSLPVEDYICDLGSLINGSEEDMKNLIDFLRTRVSSGRKSKMLLDTFPEFGYFVTKGLECVAFEEIGKCKISDFEERIPLIESSIARLDGASGSRDLEHLEYYKEELMIAKDALEKSRRADENYKLLCLAKKMNMVTKK